MNEGVIEGIKRVVNLSLIPFSSWSLSKIIISQSSRLGDGLVENQRKIVMLIASNPKISKQEMQKLIGISSTAIDKNIEKLKRIGIIERVGPAKGGIWKIITDKIAQ